MSSKVRTLKPEEGQISDPIDSEIGFQVVQRIDAEAGCLQIFVKGTDDAARSRAKALYEKLQAGADFATLARSESDDAESAARGGQLAIFRRGPRDTLVKAAAFAVAEGELAPVVATPLGFHIVKRVPPGNVDPALFKGDFKQRARRFIQLPFHQARHQMQNGDIHAAHFKPRGRLKAKQTAANDDRTPALFGIAEHCLDVIEITVGENARQIRTRYRNDDRRRACGDNQLVIFSTHAIFCSDRFGGPVY